MARNDQFNLNTLIDAIYWVSMLFLCYVWQIMFVHICRAFTGHLHEGTWEQVHIWLHHGKLWWHTVQHSKHLAKAGTHEFFQLVFNKTRWVMAIYAILSQHKPNKNAIYFTITSRCKELMDFNRIWQVDTGRTPDTVGKHRTVPGKVGTSLLIHFDTG